MTDNRLAIQAILTMSKDALVDGENTAVTLAYAIAPDAGHVPGSELRNYIQSRLREPILAAYVKPPPSPTDVELAVARTRSYASPLGYGVDQSGRTAPLPMPDGYEPPPGIEPGRPLAGMLGDAAMPASSRVATPTLPPKPAPQGTEAVTDMIGRLMSVQGEYNASPISRGR